LIFKGGLQLVAIVTMTGNIMVTLTGNIIVDQPVVAHFEPKSLAAKFSGDFQVISEQPKFSLIFCRFLRQIFDKK
jgi:hypothetical protein